MRSVGWVAPILTAVAIFIHDIGESGSARAESKAPAKKSAAASTISSHWNHNGSAVSLVSEGKKQKFFYDAPRVGLLDAGVKPGTLLFDGQRSGQNFEGLAYQFYRTCKAHGFLVTGSTSDDRKTITLKGKAPLLDMNCNVTGSRDDVLIFTASQTAPNEPPKDTPVANASGTKASAQAPNTQPPTAQTPNVVGDAKKSAVASTVVPSAPSAAAEGGSAKPTEQIAASKAASLAGAVAPSEPPKDKAAAIEPPKDKPVAANSASEKAPPPPGEMKQPATQTASTTTNSLAAASSAAPPAEPVKANQSAAVPGANTGAPKSEVPTPANNTATPKVEPPKDTQVAAIPDAAKTAAKTAAKADDTGVSKNAATAAVVPPPINLPAKTESSKTEAPKTEAPKIEAPKTAASKTESSKTPVLVENKATPTSPPEKMMEIVLKNGRILRIGRDVELETLS